MTGYTVHTGTTVKFSGGWDRIFSGKKPAKAAGGAAKKTVKKAPANAAKVAGKKAGEENPADEMTVTLPALPTAPEG